jgi:hypothetical protein
MGAALHFETINIGEGVILADYKPGLIENVDPKRRRVAIQVPGEPFKRDLAWDNFKRVGKLIVEDEAEPLGHDAR